VELPGGLHGVLAGHGVQHQDGLRRSDGGLDLLQLFHELVVNVQATAGVHQQPLDVQLPGALQTVTGHRHRRRGGAFLIHGDV
jgi:redox-sensitive bicupin YhaK (pirin superfamily)